MVAVRMTDQQTIVAVLSIVRIKYGRTLQIWLQEAEREREWERVERIWRIRRPFWERELADIRNANPNGREMIAFNFWWEESGRPMQ